MPIVAARLLNGRPMERLLLVLDELDDAVGVMRHLWLGVSHDIVDLCGWAVIAFAPGILVYVAGF